MGTGTPHSSRRSITSDYDTSSILDSASMYGGDEPSTPSPPARSHLQESHDAYLDADDLPAKKNSSKKKATGSPSVPSATLVTAKPSSPPSVSVESRRNVSVTGDDIEAAFDAIYDSRPSASQSKEHGLMLSPNSLFGLSTIEESIDTDEYRMNSDSEKHRTDEDLDFDNYFNQIKKANEEEKRKPSTSHVHSQEPKRFVLNHSTDISTPSTSIALNIEPIVSPSTTTSKKNGSISENLADSTDDDVDELLGKLEVSIAGKYTHTYIHADSFLPATAHHCSSSSSSRTRVALTDFSSRLTSIRECMCAAYSPASNAARFEQRNEASFL